MTSADRNDVVRLVIAGLLFSGIVLALFGVGAGLRDIVSPWISVPAALLAMFALVRLWNAMHPKPLVSVNIAELVAEKLGQLEQLSNDALLEMPAHVGEKRTISGIPISISTYHDCAGENRHQIVVQVSGERYWGMMNAVAAEGFAIAEDGSRRRLQEEELWDFT